MDQLIVTLEGTDHKIGEDETTECGLPVPHGSTRDDDAKPCKVCFGIVEEQEALNAAIDSELEKPAKKAAKVA